MGAVIVMGGNNMAEAAGENYPSVDDAFYNNLK